jgi:hypothetical protein
MLSIFIVPPKLISLENETADEGLDVVVVCEVAADPKAELSFQKIGSSEPYALGNNVSCRIFVAITLFNCCYFDGVNKADLSPFNLI